MEGDTLLILSLINKLGLLLPCYTNKSGEPFEADEVLRGIVKSLVEISEFRLSVTSHAILNLLDKIGKTAANSQSNEESQYNIKYSQTFLIQLLVSCMVYYWQRFLQKSRTTAVDSFHDRAKASPFTAFSDPSLHTHSATPVSRGFERSLASGLVRRHSKSTAKSELLHRDLASGEVLRGANAWRSEQADSETNEHEVQLELLDKELFVGTFQDTFLRPVVFTAENINISYVTEQRMLDPPALEEPLAKYIFNSVLRHIVNSSPSASNDMSTLVATLDQSRVFYMSTPYSFQYLTGSLASTYVPTIDNLVQLAFSPIRRETHAALSLVASRVIYFLSATNWNVVFSRIKSRMQSLANSPDEFGDIQELRILESCYLTTPRLSQVLQELSMLFLQFRRNVQLAVMPTLYRMIWNWIESFPADFIALWKSGRRLDGNPEILFDICISFNDNAHSKTKLALWPLQAMLLLLCPDVFAMLVNFEGGSKASKRRVFLDNLSKAMRNSRNFEAAAHTYIDFIKAASYLSQLNNTPLGSLVSDIEQPLRERLFDFRSPPLDPSNGAEQKFMIHALTTYYRYDPHLTVRQLVPLFLQDGIPGAYRLILAKTCYTLTIEPMLPWHPPLAMLHSSVASPMRKLFQTYVDQAAFTGETVARKPQSALDRALLKRAPKSLDLEAQRSERIEIILTLLKAYRTDPMSSVCSKSPEVQFQENLALFASITTCFREPVATIRSMAAYTVLALHKTVYIEQWGPEAMITGSFWTISSQVLLSVAREILDFQDRDEGIKFMLRILLRLLSKRNLFIEKHASHITQGIEVQDRLVASVAMEIALLVLLCSAEINLINMALDCFAYLCDEALLTEEVETPDHSNFTIVKNYAVYRELSNTESIITGKVAQQKRIRRFLRQMSNQTMGNLAAWEEAYKRWRILIQGVTRGLDGGHDDDPTGTLLGSSSSATNLSTKEFISSTATSTVEKIKKKTPFHQKLSMTHNNGRHDSKDNGHGHYSSNHSGASPVGGMAGLSSHSSNLNLMSGGSGAFGKAGHHFHHVSVSSATSSFEEPRVEDRGEWQNYTGFLCALGGVCIQGAGPTGVPGNHSSTSLPMASGAGNGMDSLPMLNQFMQEIVKLLVCEDIYVRETIKDILGADLSPALFSILLSHLQKVVGRFVTEDGDVHCTDHGTLFVGQVISVVKMILERMNEPTVSLFAVDLGSLVFSFARYLHRLGNNPMALQMKIRMCQLTEILMQKKEYLSLRHEIKFRNKLLDIIISWTSDFSPKAAEQLATGVGASGGSGPGGPGGSGVGIGNSGLGGSTNGNGGSGSGGVSGSNLGISGNGHTKSGSAPDTAGTNTVMGEELGHFHQNEKLHRDLDQACMKSVVSLLLGLPLQPLDNVPESELRMVKSNLFFRYFSFFIKLLNRCRVLEIIEGSSHRSKLTQDLKNLMSKSKEYVKDLGPLKEYTILALSNLLSANVESGLKYSLTMGYNEDTKIRTSFMQVLTNILNQGTEFDGLAESSLAEKQDKLLQLILEPNMTIALALCDVCPVQDIDELSPVLLSVFDARGRTMPLLKAVIEKELLKTDSAPELFRRNCIATRLLGSFAKLYGAEYLRDTLQPVLHSFITKALMAGGSYSFELDPTKLAPGSNPTRNLAHLRDLCHGILDAITQSSPNVPVAFREFCSFLKVAVNSRFPGAHNTAVGGFIFLRFFCPAIVAPDSHHLVPSIQSKEIRRGLILATKVIQNLANDVLFGTKESFMTPLNDFLMTNKHKVTTYFVELAKPGSGGDGGSTQVVGRKNHVDPNDIVRLHRFVLENLEKIGRDMISVKQVKPLALATPTSIPGLGRSSLEHTRDDVDTVGVSSRSLGDEGGKTSLESSNLAPTKEPGTQRLSAMTEVIGGRDKEYFNSVGHVESPELPSENSNLTEIERLTQSRKLYDQLCTLISELGKPPEVPRSEDLAAAKGGASTELYREFMQRNGHRNVDPIKSKRLFYAGRCSKEKRPIVYFIARRLIADSTDMDMLMLHVFQTLEPLMKKPFELLMDLTQFGHANEIQSQWINQFIHLLPALLTQNLHTVYMYNVNTSFKQYTKRLLSTIPLNLNKRIIFPFNLNELYAHINPTDLDLPKGTISLETDNGVNISPVSRIFHMKPALPTIIKITSEAIQIISLKKQEVCGMSSYFNDVYHISELDDVTLVTSPRHDETLVVVKFDRGNSSMTFSSPKYELIFKAIRNTRARFQMSKPSTFSERLIRPNDVPGTLLNMALLNSGSDDPNLRLAAYNLLCALSLNFNFDVGNLLFNASGLCIPANNTSFIISISHKIAECEPRFTLEFLSECFVGFSKSNTALKHLCLEYMAPWLPNLALFCKRRADQSLETYRQSVTKTVEVIKVLVEMTVKESEMYPSVQSKIWRKLGRAEELLDVILNFFVQYAVECGPFSTQAEVLANTIVTLAAVNVRTAKLLSRLRKLLVRTSVNPARVLLEHPSWSEIAVLIRFSLMLMYNNPAAAQQYLPEIFFNIVMVIGIGPPNIRASVHGLVINVIQSLIASVAMDKADLKVLNSLVTQLSEPRFRLMFGLHQVSGNSAVMHVTGSGSDVDPPDTTSLLSLETIIQSLLSILDCKTFSMDVANGWRARWMSLVTSTAFQYNLAIQPRAFVMLGCLASDEVDDDLLYQVLVTLRGALVAFDEKDTNLVHSIVRCLTKLVDKLPMDSQFLPSMFWLALAIVQIGNVTLFTSGLALMDEVLRALDRHSFFDNMEPYQFLLSSRQGFEDTISAIDATHGVNFYTDFSFALATYLIKGLHHPSSKSGVLNVLHTFIGIHTNRSGVARGSGAGATAVSGGGDVNHNGGGSSSGVTKQISPQVLGAVVPLLPASAKNGELGELLWHLGLGDVNISGMPTQNCYHQILDRFETPTETSALLLASFLVVMLNLTEFEGEQLFLYGFLSEVAVTFPDTFALIYRSLMPKMNQALLNSQHLPTLEAIQGILLSVVSLPKHTLGKVSSSLLTGNTMFGGGMSLHSGLSSKSDGSSGRNSTHEDKLHEIGFSGLMDTATLDSIQPTVVKRNAMLASSLVDRVVS
ncbi:Ras GTPase activating protein ira2 [Dispira simplex]|nr:Ras GTPase activating protein ira2 [Dispira simplex]